MKKLYRSQKDKMIAGICGGLGDMFEIDSTLLRLALVFIGLATGLVPIIVAYIVGWIIIPLASSEQSKNIGN
jgi:phage shock protein C